MILFSSLLVAAFVTMALIPPLMRAAIPLGFIDRPGPRKLHGAAVPRVGGLAMVAGTLLPVMLWLPLDRVTLGWLAGAAVIVGFGVWDDRRELDYRAKFLAQLIAVAAVMGIGDIVIRSLPFLGEEALPDAVAVPLTVVVLLGVTNAINLADGLDGLAGGTTLLSAGAIGLLGFSIDHHDIALMATALIGSILGFLRFNTHPARVFMGDTGSQFLGFTTGVLAVALIHAGSGTLSPALPLLLLGLPILDTLMVMAQRLYLGRSPFAADRNHIHHKLLSLGLDHYEAVSLIYLVQSALVVVAYLLRFQSDAVIVAIYAVFCLGAAITLFSADAAGWRAHRALARGAEPVFTARLRAIRNSAPVGQWAAGFVSWTLPAYYAASLVAAHAVSLDVGLLAAIIFVVLVALWLRYRGGPLTWIERGGAYAVGAMMLYVPQAGDEPAPAFVLASNIYFAALTAAVVLSLALSSDGRRFRLTPLDLLVILIAFVAPNLAGTLPSGAGYGVFVAKLIALFYAVELMLSSERKPNLVRPFHVAATLLLGMHAVL